MKSDNIRIFLILSFLTFTLWFVKNVDSQNRFFRSNPEIAQVVDTGKEVYGVMTGKVPLEKYLNVNRIMDSMVNYDCSNLKF